MTDQKHGKDAPPETYVKRTERELGDLQTVFRKSWLLAIVIILVLCVVGAYELGLFPKKDEQKNSSADVVAMANKYIALVEKYQKLQQQNDAAKDEEIRKLKEQIDNQQRDLDNKARGLGSVLIPDPTAYGGQRLISAAAINAWTACVRRSSASSATDTLGPISVGGSTDGQSKTCNAIFQHSGIDSSTPSK